jgi:hypothetical protein
MIAAAWSAPGAPASWRLRAAQLSALSDDRELLAIAATVPSERLPALLFQAAATFLVLELEPRPLRDWFPRVGVPQPPLGLRFVDEYRAFCLDHRDQLLELCATHRYQMNEVGRCADLVPALAPAGADGRELALVDIGTGAGLSLYPDYYRYRFRRPNGSSIEAGATDSSVLIETDLRGALEPPVPVVVPPIACRTASISSRSTSAIGVSVRGWRPAFRRRPARSLVSTRRQLRTRVLRAG